MCKKLFVLLLLCLLTEVNASPSNQNWTTYSLNWVNNNRTYVDEVIKTGSPLEVIPVMNTIGEIWLHRDGAIAGEISGIMLDFLRYQPDVFFLWFKEDDKNFNYFVNNAIPGFVFLAQEKEQLHILKTLRTEVILSLEQYITNIENEKNRANAIILLNSINNTSVRIPH